MSRAIVEQVFARLVGPELGGPVRIAGLLNIPEQTVYHWRRVGQIPSKWQAILLAFARERGLPLRAEHFFELADDGPASSSEDDDDDEKPCLCADGETIDQGDAPDAKDDHAVRC